MSYEAWRISFQDSEQAARAAFEEASKLRRERDALAAHVEDLCEYVSNCPEADDLLRKVDEWFQATPETSLARLKADVAERALSEAHVALSERREWVAAYHLLQVSSEINERLRRQAKGGAA